MGAISGLGDVVAMKTSAVRACTRNPRKIPPKAVDIVAESLSRFGWQQPIVVDKGGEIVVGHTRLAAAKKLGLTEVPVVVAEHLTDDEVAAYRIADNRTRDFTTWDFPELVAQLEELSGDFSDVLALADWQSIVAEFEDGDLDLPRDVKNDMAGYGFELTVVFEDEDMALAVEQLIFDLPGVLDVRHKQ